MRCAPVGLNLGPTFGRTPPSPQINARERNPFPSLYLYRELDLSLRLTYSRTKYVASCGTHRCSVSSTDGYECIHTSHPMVAVTNGQPFVSSYFRF